MEFQMESSKPRATDVRSQVKTLMSSACIGDIDAIRAQVAGGFDLNGRNHFGDTILEYAINALEYYPETPKYEVVHTMLKLGADPNGLSQDGSTPLFAAVMNMDSGMLRLLLDAGADPNVFRTRLDGGVESLYDWASHAYLYEVWKSRPPLEATAAERDEDVWLAHLSRLAGQYGKRRPDHLQLLRERGARSTAEGSSRCDPERARTAPFSCPVAGRGVPP
jgi:hypothetical protein